MKEKIFRSLCASVALCVSLIGGAAAAELNIYSARHYDVDKEVYAKFEAETGIKVNVVEGKGDELLERLTREQGASKADLFLTVGAESLYPLKEQGLIEGFSSEKVEANIPARYRGEGWMGITSRARIVVYNPDKVNPEEIKTYADLADSKWKGRILVRSSSSSYNLGLLASFIQLDGSAKAYNWAEGVAANLARKPKGNDRDQAKAVVAGEGDVAIMNSYYLVRMLRSSDPAEAEVAQKIRLLFPANTHVNISFAALVKGAANKDNAVRFMEFLSDNFVQNLYADANGEFPLNPSVALPEIQASWGSFEPQKLNFELLGRDRKEAAMLFDQVGWK